MINASTAIVGNGVFFHYCHKSKGLMALRIHWESCPLCLQKNPDYIPNKVLHIVSNLSNGKNYLAFENQIDAIKYIQKHSNEDLALGDIGYVQ